MRKEVRIVRRGPTGWRSWFTSHRWEHSVTVTGDEPLAELEAQAERILDRMEGER